MNTKLRQSLHHEKMVDAFKLIRD